MTTGGPGTKRGSMSPARKTRIWLAFDGRCACGVDVPCLGKGVTYDHDIQLWMEGPEEDANVRPLCDPCNLAKTADDATVRAKVKRLWAKAPFRERTTRGRKIPGRPMESGKPNWPKGRKIPGRPMRSS